MSAPAVVENLEPVEQETAIVPLSCIEAPEANVREDFGDVDGLAQTIRQTGGLLENLVVFRVGEDSYRLIAGERRYRAAQLAGCITVPVTIRGEPTALERIELQMIENQSRLDLSTPEVIKGVQGMFDLGASEDRVAQAIGQPADEVATLRAIISLGQPVIDLINNGDLSLANSVPLAELAGLGEEYIAEAVDCIHRGHNATIAARQAMGKHRRDEIVREATAVAQRRKLRLIDAPPFAAFEYGGTVRKLGRGPATQWLDVPVKEHSKQPCHAAYIDQHAPNVKAAIVLVCTEPSRHRAPGATPPVLGVGHGSGTPPVELTAGQKAAQTRRHRTDLAATHVARNVAITALIQTLPLDEAMGRAAQHILGEELPSREVSVTAARLLGVADLEPATDPTKLIFGMAAESGERALRVAIAVLTARAEKRFQNKEGLGYRADEHGDRRNVREHFRLLQRHGYVLQSPEVAHLDRYCGVTGFTTGSGEQLVTAEDEDGSAFGDDLDAMDDGDFADAA
jgi:ParB/RepB/Spo0J family partition protein